MNKFLHDYQTAAEECARYIMDSEWVQTSYEEFIQDNNDPRDHILYNAAIVLCENNKFQSDVDEYVRTQ